MKKIRVTPAEGRVLTMPQGIPNIAGVRLAGAQPAIPKHDIEATTADPPLELDYDAMPEEAAAKLRAFLRKRELAGDCTVEKLPNLAAPRPTSATTTAKE